MTTLSTIGAGNIGFNVAKAAIQAGYDVVLSNSRGPESLADKVAELGERARAATAQEAAEAGDMVLVAVPLHAIDQVPGEALAGKIVIDANNYYPQRDERIQALDTNALTTSELVQAHLKGARIVKAFNHIYASQIPTDGQSAGSDGRRALAVAGDDAEAKARVVAFLDELGYDAVDLGPLSESWRIERDTPGYGPRMTAAELSSVTAGTERIKQL